MEIKKVYVKKRTEFGKQCVFDVTEPTLDVNMHPNPADMVNYITRTHCHAGAQKSTQLAAHEAQTGGRTTRNSGMCHFEGGWPREINPRDEEATARFRRRVEKDDHWAPKLHNLFGIVEGGVLQNGAVNIYQHYFDDMVPTELVQPLSLRAVKAYADPESPKRPVTNISWCPDSGSRIAVSYCFLEFGRRADYSNTVYVWQVDNPNEPYMAMEPFCPCVASEFNPRDPSVLAGGLMTGQVCYWDLRISGKPIQYTNLLVSHRTYVNSVKWVHSKSNAEFFSTSLDGRTMCWDTRWLRQPVEEIIFDLEKPNEPSMDRAIGISSTNFGPIVGTKCMFGMDNGTVMIGSRKAKTNAEKLAVKFEAHFGPVVAVDRNVFNPAIFMSVGDWRVKIWAEDTREGNLVSTVYMKDNPTVGCWNKTRNSVFYVATDAGTLVAWDLLQKLRNPIFKLQLGKEKITALAPYDEGTYIAVGNYNGSTFLVESTGFFESFDRKDRTALSEYLERCSKLTKAVDVRLREIKLLQKLTAEVEEEAAMTTAPSKVREKKKPRKKEKDRDAKEGDVKSKENKEVRRSPKESKKKLKDELATIQLMEAENKYYEIVEQELQKYADKTEPELRPIGPIQSTAKKQDRKAKTRQEEKEEKEERRRTGKKASEAMALRRRTLMSRHKSMRKSSVAVPAVSVERALPSDTSVAKKRSEQPAKKKKKRIIKFRLPVACKGEICRPNVCCFRTDKKTPAKEGSSGSKKSKTPSAGSSVSKLTNESAIMTMKQAHGVKSRALRAVIRWKKLDLPLEFMQEVERARREISEARSSRSARAAGRIAEIADESRENARDSDPSRSRKRIDSEENRHEDPPEDEEDGTRETSADREGRVTRAIPDPCTAPKGKSISRQFTAMIGAPMPSSIEGDVEGKSYLAELEAVRRRIYPRISEFHSIE